MPPLPFLIPLLWLFPLFLPAMMKCCYASIILLWGETVAAVQVQTGFNCRERWCWVYGLWSGSDHCIAGVRGGSDPGFRSVSGTPSSWPWHVTLRPPESPLKWCLFVTVSYVFSFSFMLLLLCLCAFLWAEIHMHVHREVAQGGCTALSVSWLAWVTMD